MLVDGVGDNPSAVTRFVLVSRPTPPAPPTGADKTSVVVFQSDDHPGGLLELLEQFAARGINLTWIQSRPTGESLGRYSFAIDAEGHVAEARVAEALMGLHRVCTEVRFLGSYPRASGEQTPTLASTTDRAFADSRAWLQRVLDGPDGSSGRRRRPHLRRCGRRPRASRARPDGPAARRRCR